MNGVTQKHYMSCGVACVSYLTGVAYDEIAKALSPIKLNFSGFLGVELIDILKKHGLNYAGKQLKGDEAEGEFKIGDIVFIEKSASYWAGHFLVKSDKGWMDPWINLNSAKPWVTDAKSGFREKLPGKPGYLIYKIT
ncbi:MAG TPA: hypothetical protein VM124_01015 [Candidatus Limnocylindrales bacterium]|nr:hypothetical protein [Candidatus Limnocylindrales bacterium]